MEKKGGRSVQSSSKRVATEPKKNQVTSAPTPVPVDHHTEITEMDQALQEMRAAEMQQWKEIFDVFRQYKEKTLQQDGEMIDLLRRVVDLKGCNVQDLSRRQEN